MHLTQENTSKDDGTGYHLGNLILEYFNTNEDHVWQVDAGTGEVEMKSSIKCRSIQLARCLRNAGLKPGDVLIVSAVNHLNAHIPFYAGYLNGMPVSGIDPVNIYEEIKVFLNIIKPKLVFCESPSLEDYERASRDLGLDTRVVTFGDSRNSYTDFVKMYDDQTPDNEFKVAHFNTDEVYAWLISTSGTTGLPKVAAIKHCEILKVVKMSAIIRGKERVPLLNQSSIHWVSSYLATLCNISSNQYIVQTSSPQTVEHMIDVINKYKPTMVSSSPLLFVDIVRHQKYCDLTCFKKIVITGFNMNPDIFKELQARVGPNGCVWNLMGQTECVGCILMPAPEGPQGNCGYELKAVPVQLVDTNTGEVITEPNRPGELWTKGPRFTEYYNNPEATAAVFSPDGWYKTGDLLYRDENGFFFYVERMTSSFRYRNYFVTPLELEQLIQVHPDVLDVCVVGIPHPEDGKQAVACVQRRPGSTLTEQDVKDIVACKLSVPKHIHGGVIFIVDFPRTVSGKIARGKVQDYVLQYRKAVSEYPSSGNRRHPYITSQCKG
ncbi:luciferin 4-monooxygenase-like [Leguminivora glycinivorella]|uniref:luciferin 4-monooxygenase-like n=1 Tax=Leguminivora glycinivorella TaxID=1035111 RepID=UPI00200CF7BB|nr:luciferin 4-monooxygenase-like [Leguminivora glycinivorella]